LGRTGEEILEPAVDELSISSILPSIGKKIVSPPMTKSSKKVFVRLIAKNKSDRSSDGRTMTYLDK
jgi:hypothetical protein